MRKIMKIDQKSLEDIPDLYKLVYDLTAQVPEGKVTTYGSIARAIGDIRASRSIGEIEHENPRPIIVPCHRVVYADGGLSGFGAPGGSDTKKKLLFREGIRVRDGKIQNFDKRLFTDFELQRTKPLVKARNLQERLSAKVKLDDDFEDTETVCGIDVSYSGRTAYGAAVVTDVKTKAVLEEQTVEYEVNFPYIPTYLAFRELPVVVKLISKLTYEPDVLMMDGNGILHPRKFGVASHIGVVLNRPTVGAAKKLLCGSFDESKLEKMNDSTSINYEKQNLGFALLSSPRSQKPIYISPGNRISLRTTLELSKNFTGQKMLAPIRDAHVKATECRKEHSFT
jgi:deoxyribonuclease V